MSYKTNALLKRVGITRGWQVPDFNVTNPKYLHSLKLHKVLNYYLRLMSLLPYCKQKLVSNNFLIQHLILFVKKKKIKKNKQEDLWRRLLIRNKKLKRPLNKLFLKKRITHNFLKHKLTLKKSVKSLLVWNKKLLKVKPLKHTIIFTNSYGKKGFNLSKSDKKKFTWRFKRKLDRRAKRKLGKIKRRLYNKRLNKLYKKKMQNKRRAKQPQTTNSKQLKQQLDQKTPKTKPKQVKPEKKNWKLKWVNRKFHKRIFRRYKWKKWKRFNLKSKKFRRSHSLKVFIKLKKKKKRTKKQLFSFKLGKNNKIYKVPRKKIYQIYHRKTFKIFRKKKNKIIHRKKLPSVAKNLLYLTNQTTTTAFKFIHLKKNKKKIYKIRKLYKFLRYRAPYKKNKYKRSYNNKKKFNKNLAYNPKFPSKNKHYSPKHIRKNIEATSPNTKWAKNTNNEKNHYNKNQKKK